jgi:hypothetical protein
MGGFPFGFLGPRKENSFMSSPRGNRPDRRGTGDERSIDDVKVALRELTTGKRSAPSRAVSAVQGGWGLAAGIAAAVLGVAGLGVAQWSGNAGGGAAAASKQGPVSNDALTDLKTMLDAVKAGQQKAPKSAAEMAAIEPMFTVSGAFIQNGSIEYVWGTALVSGPDAGKRMVGFETKAVKEGGCVLLQDGTLKEVSAAEFAGLEKAKP